MISLVNLFITWKEFWIAWNNVWGIIGWVLLFSLWGFILFLGLFALYNQLKNLTFKKGLKLIFFHPYVIIALLLLAVGALTSYFDSRSQKKENIQDQKNYARYLDSTKYLREYERKGMRFFNLRKYDSAILYFRKADEESINDSTKFFLGSALEELDSTKSALKIMKALEENNFLMGDSVYRHLSALYLDLHKYRKSIRFADSGLRVKDEAIFHYIKALDLLALSINFNLNFSNSQKGLDSASFESLHAYKLKPSNRYKSNFELIQYYKGNKVHSKHVIDSILHVDSTKLTQQYCSAILARISISEKDYPGAAKYLTACIKMNPKDENKYFFRAICYIHTNSIDRACLDFNKAWLLGNAYAKDSLLKYGLRSFKTSN